MADLQATAAAKNIALNLAGKSAIEKFNVELNCIVDTLDKGILVIAVYRVVLYYQR